MIISDKMLKKVVKRIAKNQIRYTHEVYDDLVEDIEDIGEPRPTKQELALDDWQDNGGEMLEALATVIHGLVTERLIAHDFDEMTAESAKVILTPHNEEFIDDMFDHDDDKVVEAIEFLTEGEDDDWDHMLVGAIL